MNQGNKKIDPPAPKKEKKKLTPGLYELFCFSDLKSEKSFKQVRKLLKHFFRYLSQITQNLY